MEQKRFLLFVVLSLAILMGWQVFVASRLQPPQKVANPPAEVADKPVADQPADDKPVADRKEAGNAAADATGKPADGKADKPVAEMASATKPESADDGAEDPAAKDQSASKDKGGTDKDGKDTDKADEPPGPTPARHPARVIKLGSLDPETGFRMLAVLTTRGGSVAEVQLSDHRYRDLQSPNPPLRLIGNHIGSPLTLDTKVPQFGFDLTRYNWEVLDGATDSEVTFRLKSADGKLEIRKHYTLHKVDPETPDQETPAYLLGLDLTLINHDTAEQLVNYELQGPVGLPLENVDNTQKFRDVVVGFLKDGSVNASLMTAKTVASNVEEKTVEIWQEPLKYLGVDIQYFAALILPQGDQAESSYAKSSSAELIGKGKADHSEISTKLTSVDLKLAPEGEKKAGGNSVTHAYKLFAGPKRHEMLTVIGAPDVLDYGMFSFISRPMLALLNMFYALFGSYGMAIICLTIVVRCAMFPLSIKQARSAVMMQRIQPEIAALKEKYGKDKEKMAKAQMELFSKHNYNPFGGCLLVFVQLPVFMGLYQALGHAVDLRMAPFLWMDNLAAPDALFHMPFKVPFVGWTEFNLLPMLTIVLFIFQQKMFMPPPTSDEQALQQKMMSYMMVFMGFMFYRVPAGLCVYFIASSLWGMGERKLLPKVKPVDPNAPPAPPAVTKPGTRPPESGKNGSADTWFSRLLKAADKEVAAKRTPQNKRR